MLKKGSSHIKVANRNKPNWITSAINGAYIEEILSKYIK